MRLRTRKDSGRRMLMAFLRAVPDECAMPATFKREQSYTEAVAVLEGALSKITADEIDAIDTITMALLKTRRQNK